MMLPVTALPELVVLDGYALNPGDLSWDALAQITHLTVHPRTAGDEIAARSANAALLLTNKTPLRAALLDTLPQLKYIGVLATGYDVVDTRAARERAIVVTNVPTYGTASVAQFVFAHLLEMCHHVSLHNQAVHAGEWRDNADWCFAKTPLTELAGKTLGIIGFGRIGRKVGEIGHAFGMRVVAHSVPEENPLPYDDFAWLPLEDLLRTADVVSLHCPLTPETDGLINAARLSLMKQTAIIVNTARGKLVNNTDLAAALNSGAIAGACLDVLTVEPPRDGNPLLQARNCQITPHQAWATKEARGRLLDIAVENVRAFLAGHPVNVVNQR
jgi:glycerate dehydrogenase